MTEMRQMTEMSQWPKCLSKKMTEMSQQKIKQLPSTENKFGKKVNAGDNEKLAISARGLWNN